MNPSSNELKTLKFAGEPLTSLEPLMKTSQLLAQNYFPKILSNNNFTVTIFGEWIQCGTASSKEDKFCYAEKGTYVFFIKVKTCCKQDFFFSVLHNFCISSFSLLLSWINWKCNEKLRKVLVKYCFKISLLWIDF